MWAALYVRAGALSPCDTPRRGRTFDAGTAMCRGKGWRQQYPREPPPRPATVDSEMGPIRDTTPPSGHTSNGCSLVRELWKAIDDVFPGTRHQRCWVHKTANVLSRRHWRGARSRGADGAGNRHSTAPIAPECQSFLDNLVAGFGLNGSWNDPNQTAVRRVLGAIAAIRIKAAQFWK
jgi:hypothetical protein